MAESLIFELSEFEVLEQPFEFEEEVRKPEQSRFFTLDEQLVDFFEKSMPARKPTKYELNQLKNDRDRIRMAYGNYITVTETDYVIDTNRKTVNVSWIHPVYTEFSYKPYNYETEWKPFFEQARRRTPNYYPQLLEALPKPYASSEGRPLLRSEMLVNKEGLNPINGLTNYVMTKTIINDDGTTDILKFGVPNTADDLKTSGFFLDNRPDIPRPLADHPFLKSSQASYFETSNSLLDIYPSIPAILEHAMPVTNDPYTEGLPILKLYDIKLSQVPWSSWKERFPPVDQKETPKSFTAISFKNERSDKPGDILTKLYSSWYPGLDSRKWLNEQIDGGFFVSKLLLSEASSSGLLPAPPPMEIAPAEFPEAQPEMCMNLTANFDTFLSSGLYRPILATENREKFLNGMKCVVIPVGTIQQEKRDSGFKGRLGWKETTKNDILIDYQRLLKTFQNLEPPSIVVEYEVAARQIQSERHRDILVILEDPHRTPEDQADAIELLTRDLNLENKIYYDTADQFVLCSHTLALLRGQLGDSNSKFYSEWTTSNEGARTCKFCGEQITKDTFIATKEYDEDGHVTMEHSAIDEQIIHGEDPFVNSILQLKRVFDLDNAGENVLYTILSFLQILPKEAQVLPILQLIRKLTIGLKARAASSKAISKEKQDLVEGVLGIAGSIVLLQAHTPFLIPKKNIGNKPLAIHGFPRDSDDPQTCNALISVLTILRRTFESFPTTYKGNVATVLRAILRNSKDVRDQSLQWIRIFADQFKALFDNARERYTPQEQEPLKNLIQLPIEKIDNPVFAPGETLDSEQPLRCSAAGAAIWTTKRLPSVTQKGILLQSRIESSDYKIQINPEYISTKFNVIADKEIRRRVALGLPAGFSMLNEFVKISDGPAFTSLTTQLLTVLSKTAYPVKALQTYQEMIVYLNTQESQALLRDTAKGILFDVLHSIKAPAVLRAIMLSIKTDLAIRMILLSEAAAEKEDFELRAKERNTLKAALRSTSDMEREITQKMLSLGIADWIITNQDRERFAKEFRMKEEEVPEDDLRPEEGYSAERDYVENGDQPVAADGTQLEVDYGDYGDRAVRDYNDYTTQDLNEED